MRKLFERQTLFSLSNCFGILDRGIQVRECGSVSFDRNPIEALDDSAKGVFAFRDCVLEDRQCGARPDGAERMLPTINRDGYRSVVPRNLSNELLEKLE